MKENLFRGKRVNNGKWVKGGFHKWETRQVCPFGDELSPEEVKYLIIGNTNADWNMPREICATEVDPKTVGQYIGQPDRDGIKIFEGDILKAKVRCGQYYRNEIGYVVFDEYGLKYELKIRKNEIYKYKLIPNQTDCEVIGNIYDNPELLETPTYTEVSE